MDSCTNHVNFWKRRIVERSGLNHQRKSSKFHDDKVSHVLHHGIKYFVPVGTCTKIIYFDVIKLKHTPAKTWNFRRFFCKHLEKHDPGQNKDALVGCIICYLHFVCEHKNLTSQTKPLVSSKARAFLSRNIPTENAPNYTFFVASSNVQAGYL